jgi:hypothetical protein
MIPEWRKWRYFENIALRYQELNDFKAFELALVVWLDLNIHDCCIITGEKVKRLDFQN